MELDNLSGITKAKLKQFNNKGIFTVEDLLNYLPRKYHDLSHITGILAEEQISTVLVHIRSYHEYFKKNTFLKAVGYDVETGMPIEIHWFNQHWMTDTVAAANGKNVIVSGKFSYDLSYHTFVVETPLLFSTETDKALGIYPIYSKIQGMSAEYIQRTINIALESDAARKEVCPQEIIAREGLPSMPETYRCIYAPTNMTDVDRGKARICFNDLLYFAVQNEYLERQTTKGSVFGLATLELYNKLRRSLPFSLSSGQDAVLREAIAHIRSGLRLNGLLTADVGAGKTIVAQLLMAAIVGNGYQAAMMAPTQVLARQHYDNTVALLKPLGVNVLYLGGKMKKSEKDRAFAKIASGEAQIVIGTTSIISEQIRYKSLAFVVVDEEQRFGVSQRGSLISKGKLGVHALTMSATPIPRSLAQVMYGDTVQLLTIETLPEGRLPVKTGYARNRDAVYKYILREAARKHQTYVVSPKIDRSDDVKSVETLFEEYSRALHPYGLNIGKLTGRNSAAETADILGRFKGGEIDVLISTTVIETGVDCKNATCIVITNAERFGLSQLHQLRGRVGRNNIQSICVLETAASEGTERERLDALCRTNSGIELAKEDLRIRGAGDFIGTQQSGDNKYISLMLAYPEMYKRAKCAAREMLDTSYTSCDLVKRAIEEIQSK